MNEHTTTLKALLTKIEADGKLWMYNTERKLLDTPISIIDEINIANKVMTANKPLAQRLHESK